jgi:hypothetical protein
MVVSVPHWLWLLIVIGGLLAWVAELIGKARKRMAAHREQEQLHRDLDHPAPPPSLPYGFRPDSSDPPET